MPSPVTAPVVSLGLLLVSLVMACGPRAGDPSLGLPPGGLDIHLHCQDPTQTCEGGVPCCELAGWTALTGGNDTPAGALLSLEHFTVLSPDAGRPPHIPFQNESARLTHEKAPSLLWFSSLPCWHAQAWGPGWLARCSADVDAQLALGAKGFKDHVGKTFMHSAKVGDGLRWLGAWNRAQGHCVVADGVASPNAACLEAPGARYPALEDDYRALVRHIVEDKRAVLVTHLRDFGGGPEQCLDPVQQVLRPCADVMKDQVLAFAAWAEATLSPAARRRVVIAHLAFLQGEPEVLRQVLAAGLSVDTAAMITQLRHCEARALLAQFPDQLLWGTDAELGGACLGPTMASWTHLLTGSMDEELRFTGTCAGDVTISGLDLKTAKVKRCREVLPERAYERFVGGNARTLLGL